MSLQKETHPSHTISPTSREQDRERPGVTERPQISRSPFLQVFPGYCSLRWWHEAYVDPSLRGSFFGLFLVFFLGSPVFSSCGGFSVVLALGNWIETFPSGLSEVPASRQLAYPGWKPCHLEAGSNTTSTGSSGTPRFRRPAGTSLRPELRGLRFDQFGGFRGPGADALGHTGSLPGCVERGVLCPGGGKVSN